MSEKIGAIYGAIAAMLADVEAIKKDKLNQQQGYKFRSIDQVYQAVHPLLSKHRVFPTCTILDQQNSERTSNKGGVLICVTLKCRYTFWAHDGSHIATESVGEGMDSGDKASNKAMSSAYKYAIFQLLCIPTEAVDSEVDSPEVAPRQQPAPRANGTTKPSDASYSNVFRPEAANHIAMHAEVWPGGLQSAKAWFLNEGKEHLDKVGLADWLAVSSAGMDKLGNLLDALKAETERRKAEKPKRRKSADDPYTEELGKTADNYKVGASEQFMRFRGQMLLKFKFETGRTFESFDAFIRWAIDTDDLLRTNGFTKWTDVMLKADAGVLEQLYSRAETYARTKQKETVTA